MKFVSQLCPVKKRCIIRKTNIFYEKEVAMNDIECRAEGQIYRPIDRVTGFLKGLRRDMPVSAILLTFIR